MLTIAGSLAWTIAGGVVAGGLVVGLLLLVAGRTVDHLVEITLTTIAAYGSFLLAEHFGMSGVLASLTAGLLVGNVGWKGAISESGRDHVLSFWQYAAFLANSVIFILIGGHEAHEPIALFSGAAVVANRARAGRAGARGLSAVSPADPDAPPHRLPLPARVELTRFGGRFFGLADQGSFLAPSPSAS